ncbi:MAG TPA: hypothetical protein VHQ41_00515 [Patescibacteria group bacterium]|jgi:hypothetical protein|nr:hypothetical protein [Patescibacteria group bacterium]
MAVTREVEPICFADNSLDGLIEQYKSWLSQMMAKEKRDTERPLTKRIRFFILSTSHACYEEYKEGKVNFSLIVTYSWDYQ